MQELIFKRDTAFRQDLFTPESFAHPAKLDLQLQIWLIEKYSKVGEVILDPMFGSGTCMVACTLGRHVIGVELEDKFCRMAAVNWGRVKQRPQLGYEMGTLKIIHGDARYLSHLPLFADQIITSPPYAEVSHHSDNPDDLKDIRPGRSARVAGTAGDNTANIGNLPYKADSIITSPPYEASLNDTRSRASSIDGSKSPDWHPGKYSQVNQPQCYSGVDSVITSPPYSETTQKLPDNIHIPITGSPDSKGTDEVKPARYSDSSENIGNLKAENYLAAMKIVYQECFSVLKPGGYVCLVTKNFIRDQKEVRLDLDTIRLMETSGFSFKERFYRKLPAQSFWRILYKRRFPDAPELTHEDVLIFIKPVMDLGVH